VDASIFIGWDPREASAFAVARSSVRRMIGRHIPVSGLVLEELQSRNFYRRPMSTRVNSEGRLEMIDNLSIRADYDGRISTQHAIARFLVPKLAGYGWALFMDGDMLVRSEMGSLFRDLDGRYAVYCVKHNHVPTSTVKMDGQEQTQYSRKNWSSFMIFNCKHKSNKKLTYEIINSLPGRDLHRFCWLEDDEIGELGPEWNFLVGHSDPNIDPKIVHFTDGVPDMPGYEDVPYAGEWRNELKRWALGSPVVLERALRVVG
jgi:lipopolysaccharide biosynthesis glycosyltransferase